MAENFEKNVSSEAAQESYEDGLRRRALHIRDSLLFSDPEQRDVKNAIKKLGISPLSKSWEAGDESDVQIAPEAIGSLKIEIEGGNMADGYAYFKKGALVTSDEIWNSHTTSAEGIPESRKSFGFLPESGPGIEGVTYVVSGGEPTDQEIKALIDIVNFEDTHYAATNRDEVVEHSENVSRVYDSFFTEVKKRRQSMWNADAKKE